MQQLFLIKEKKLILGCTINVQIELKKNLQLFDLSFNISLKNLNVDMY